MGIEVTSEMTATLLRMELTALETTIPHLPEGGYGHGVGHVVGRTKEGEAFT